ncbi:MAG: ArdC-like ssDNA-binding domain-containing protein [Agrobacterium tumefaciens]
MNIVSLWVAAQASAYTSNVWGTYRQWQEAGCQVRRGEKSSLVVFYKVFDVEQVNDQTGEAEPAERKVLRASWVFNAAQVDGFALDQVDIPDRPAFDPIARAEAFVKATGAVIEEGVTRPAMYRRPISSACRSVVASWGRPPQALQRDFTARYVMN